MMQEVRHLWLPFSMWPETNCEGGWVGGVLAASEGKPAPVQRALAGHLGGYFTYFTISGQCRRERPRTQDKATPQPPSISMRTRDPQTPQKAYRRKDRETAKEISYVAKPQQRAGSTNKLLVTFLGRWGVSHY